MAFACADSSRPTRPSGPGSRWTRWPALRRRSPNWSGPIAWPNRREGDRQPGQRWLCHPAGDDQRDRHRLRLAPASPRAHDVGGRRRPGVLADRDHPGDGEAAGARWGCRTSTPSTSFEVNEAFASVVLCWRADTAADRIAQTAAAMLLEVKLATDLPSGKHKLPDTPCPNAQRAYRDSSSRRGARSGRGSRSSRPGRRSRETVSSARAVRSVGSSSSAAVMRYPSAPKLSA